LSKWDISLRERLRQQITAEGECLGVTFTLP
jgi:hypothetical protein